jgi:flagellar biosynthesis GTPase FlhF
MGGWDYTRKIASVLAVFLVFGIAGCGGSSTKSQSHQLSRAECVHERELAAGRTPLLVGASKATGERAELYRELKEDGARKMQKHKQACTNLGVTHNSPPPGSAEAREAVQQVEVKEEAARNAEMSPEERQREAEINESSRRANEDIEAEKRSAASLALTEGNKVAAKRELEEGCPKFDAAEIAEAWRQLQRNHQQDLQRESVSVSELRKDDEELCSR